LNFFFLFSLLSGAAGSAEAPAPASTEAGSPAGYVNGSPHIINHVCDMSTKHPYFPFFSLIVLSSPNTTLLL
jgi:hypothetical protein